ncbi:MAG TPA: hypothetical protein VN256_13155 [Pyrinomonadaceae bacterium]|nr:hypothetical protein [Pyrinomonadaceae bacterium]
MFGELRYLRQRVITLERQLEAERAANRYREDWCINMLMRRAGTIPVPPQKAEQPEPIPVAQPTETDYAKAEALREAGRIAGASQQEIEEEIKRATGWTEQELAAAIQQSGVM